MANLPQPDNHLPGIIDRIVSAHGIEAMEPGEATWAAPLALSVAQDGTVSLNGALVDRETPPEEGVNVKIVKDFSGIFVDATALGRKEIAQLVKTRRKPDVVGRNLSSLVDVTGVFYSPIHEMNGLDPDEVQAFNAEQAEERRLFKEYMEACYRKPFKFAAEEAVGANVSGRTTRALGKTGLQRRFRKQR
jgi:hypothetical protein